MCKVRFKLFFDVITIFMRCGGVYSELVEANKWRDSAEGRGGWGGGGRCEVLALGREWWWWVICFVFYLCSFLSAHERGINIHAGISSHVFFCLRFLSSFSLSPFFYQAHLDISPTSFIAIKPNWPPPPPHDALACALLSFIFPPMILSIVRKERSPPPE